MQFTGVEASLRVRLPRYQQLDIGYTGIHGNQDLLPEVTSRYVLNYPRHQAIVGWTGTWRDALVGRTRIGVMQRFRRDAYGLVEFSVARSSGAVRPYFQMLNASNTSYQEVTGVEMPGRSVVGGVELVFPARRGGARCGWSQRSCSAPRSPRSPTFGCRSSSPTPPPRL